MKTRIITSAILIFFVQPLLQAMGPDLPAQRQVRWYRADAVIRVLSIPIFKKQGVGSGYAVFEAAGPASARRVHLQFAAGSLPEEAHGLNRLGCVEEVIELRQDIPLAARYFGFMTTSDEKSVSEARKALENTATETVSYSVIKGSMGPGICLTSKNRLVTGARYSWADWSGLMPKALAVTGAATAESHRRECDWVCENAAPVSLLYTLLTAMRSPDPDHDIPFVWNDQKYSLKTEKKCDPSVGRRLAEQSLTGHPERTVRLAGKTRSLEKDGRGKFRLWYEEGGDCVLPLRIEYQARPFLQLVFEVDPGITGAIPAPRDDTSSHALLELAE